MLYTLDIHCIGTLLVRSFVRLSVSQSIGSSFGPFVGRPIGHSAGWMHRCLPVRLVRCVHASLSEVVSVHSFVCNAVI